MTDINSADSSRQAVKSKSLIWLILSFVVSILILIFEIKGGERYGVGKLALGFILSAPLSFVAASIGDMLRKMAMPDAFFSSGMADTLKKKLFWAIGPQVIGLFLAQAVIWGAILGRK